MNAAQTTAPHASRTSPSGSVRAGDLDSLARSLAEAGLSPEEFDSLRAAMRRDGASGIAPRAHVKAWIDHLRTSASHGLTEVRSPSIASTIEPGLRAFFGEH